MSTPPRDRPPTGSGAGDAQPSPPAQTHTTPPPRPQSQSTSQGNNPHHHHHHHHFPFPHFIPPPDGNLHIFPVPMPGMGLGPPPPGFIPSVGIAPDGSGFPGGPGGPHGPNAPFTFFMSFFNGPPSNQPDPAAAEELVRSLPTVSKGLLDRVNSIVVAEQKLSGDDEEPGWKCGVCLDGLEEGTEETGTKGLPCNHLFHSACLQPWFETHHTCPTCRLDLDPLNTLRDSSREGGRPGPTGGTSRARPYGARPNPPPGAQGPETTGPQFTFVWHMPPPSEEPTPQAAPSDAPRTPTPSNQTPAAPTPSLLSPPTQTFTIPLRASPAPMGRSASDPGGQSPLNTSVGGPSPRPAAQAPAEGSTTRPVPQRRTHINVDLLGQALPGAASTGARPSNAAPPTPAPAEPVTAPFLPPNPTTVPRPPVTHIHQRGPHFHTIINIGGPPPQHTPAQAPTATPPAPTPTKAVIRESLDTWVETRERALGWRCDAPICFSAPTSDHPTHEHVPDPTISIFSPSQVAVPHSGDSFELHSCEHRWHRACLESTAKTSRRWTEGSGDDSGKVWVRCDRCRKDGWVPKLDDGATKQVVD